MPLHDPLEELAHRHRAERIFLVAEMLADGLVGGHAMVRNFFVAPPDSDRKHLRIAAP